jgi:hypothetical protein
VTRARSKVAATATGGPDKSVQGPVSGPDAISHLERVDSGVTHPKKRARLGVAPAGVVDMGAAAMAAGSNPTGPAHGL